MCQAESGGAAGMPTSNRGWVAAGILLATVVGFGCQRAYYYKQADQDAAALIEEKSADPRWGIDEFSVKVNPRSRYANDVDPVRPPMPPDDPKSSELMQAVGGMEGYDGWGENGVKRVVENPDWRKELGEYMEVDEEGRVHLDLEGAIRLAMVHSPDYQQTIETLYLSALDVSTERFRLDVQFYGGNDSFLTHRGNQGVSGESNTLTNGSSMQVRRRLATAGQIVVDFANTFTWQFAGANTNTATSLLGFSIVQPLLRSGGRVVGLEQLTRAERNLLGNLRAFQRYRKGFYTDMAIGSRGTGGSPRRSGGFFGGTGLTGFTGQGSGGFGGVGSASGFGGGFFGGGGSGGGGAGGGGAVAGVAGGGAGNVGGFIGLLQSLQQLRNSQDNLALQQRTLALLQALQEAGQIGVDQVLSFQQSIETGRADMLQSQNGFRGQVENFVMSNFGLPATFEVVLDDSVIQPFQFIDPRVTAVETAVADLVSMFGDVETPTDEQLRRTASHSRKLQEDIAGLVSLVEDDLKAMEAKAKRRAQGMTDNQKVRFASDRKALSEDLGRLQAQNENTRKQLGAIIKELGGKLNAQQRTDIVGRMIAVNAALASSVGELGLVQAGARLEAVTLDDRVSVNAEDALEIARAFRLDWMNARASLVDGWRLVEFNANALESDLSIVFSGDMKGDQTNPFELSGPKGSLRAGLQFDAPLTRLLERNNFRQQLINYEQTRRGMIQYEDQMYQSFRLALRTLEQREKNLEIQRRAVKIAIRRVDQTRQMLTKPPAPGAPAQLSPTATQDLLSALAALRSSQNNFMSVWLAYYSGRMTLMRDLGVMRIDEKGLWIDEPLEDALNEARKHPSALPPAVPEAWLEKAGEGYETARLVPTDAEDGGEAGFGFGIPKYLRPTTYLKKPAVLDDWSNRVKSAWPASWPGGTESSEDAGDIEVDEGSDDVVEDNRAGRPWYVPRGRWFGLGGESDTETPGMPLSEGSKRSVIEAGGTGQFRYDAESKAKPRRTETEQQGADSGATARPRSLGDGETSREKQRPQFIDGVPKTSFRAAPEIGVVVPKSSFRATKTRNVNPATRRPEVVVPDSGPAKSRGLEGRATESQSPNAAGFLPPRIR